MESLEKEFKTKVDGEQDEEKQKNYYSSKEYMKLEKKKTKIGMVKKKQTTDQLALTEVIWTPKIRVWYIVHLVAKFVMEIVFIYLFYLLQQQQSKGSGFDAWFVPEKYVCTYGGDVANYACSQNAEIPCWVSRPWEKMVMMFYMLAVSVLSALLVLIEVAWVTTRISVRSNRRKKQRKAEKKGLLHNMHPVVPIVAVEAP